MAATSSASAAAAVPSDEKFDALEKSILDALETLDRIDEFAQPSPTPDNDGLKLNMCAHGRQMCHRHHMSALA